MRKNIGVKAVHDSDLEQLLKKLGIFDDLIAGKLNCIVCGRLVDLDNLGTIFPRDNEICVSCDNSRCVRIVTAR